ncbi:unnamed protein product [Clonostachys rhizophaga]|uniref:Uncharacterized protein n=1 Tax=Clonostachys rhizophaga TaxID=160324 RepID=A0A9N9VV40_9HYPO|nr:unnamed protein product [Clonostachys rhizophaga]
MVQNVLLEMTSQKGQQKGVLLAESHLEWGNLVEDSPLISRGWAFQERLLAPRNIFFCKEIVFYECYEKHWSESTGLDLVPWNSFLDGEVVGNDTPTCTFKILLPTIGRDIYQTWYELVEAYCLTKLTFAEDRLAAVAEYLFSENIIMLPSTPSIEIMVRGVLKRMILRRGPKRFQVFPVAVPEAEQDMEALQKPAEDVPPHRFPEATLDFAATETDIFVLNNSGKLFYVPWYDNFSNFSCRSQSHCLLLELICGEMGRFRRIGLLSFNQEYRDVYLSPQVSGQGYPCWKYEQSTGEHTVFIV